MKAYLTLVSKESIQEPALFDICRFLAKSADGRVYDFSWMECYYTFQVDVTGRGIYDVELRDLDEEAIIDGDVGYGSALTYQVELNEMTPGFIASSRLKELLYRCFLHVEGTEDRLIPLEIKEFILVDTDSQGKEIRAEFPAEELQRYDREDAIYLNIDKKEKSKLMALVREFQGLGSGEYTHVGDWLNCLLENLEPNQDHNFLVCSLEELKAATQAMIDRIRADGYLPVLELEPQS